MSRYKALLQERADLIAEGKELFGPAEREGRDLTDEEKARDDEITARLEVLAGELTREERRREWERTVEPVARYEEPEAIPDPNRQSRSDQNPWASLGEQLLAVRAAALPNRVVDPRLQYNPDAGNGVSGYGAAVLGGNVGIPSEGGWLLQSQYTAGLWQRAYESSEILPRTFKVPIGDNADSVVVNGMAETSRATGSRWGGVQAYWVAEGGTITASGVPKFRQMRFTPQKLAVVVYATNEILRNPTTLEAIVNQVVPLEIAWMTENSIIRGSGVGKPTGILNSPALISVDKETGQAADTIVSQNISKMWARMWPRSRANAIWLINQDVEPQLDELSLQIGIGGVPTYMPPGGLSEAPYGRLKGRPVVPIEQCSTLGDLGDIVLSDFSQYGTSDRGSIRAASSIHVQFLTDQTAFRFIYEIDGQSMWDFALTPANGTNTVSPFVALAERA
jgi:HK97 family phage major capsid protein